MNRFTFLCLSFTLLLSNPVVQAADDAAHILLIAGDVQKVDRAGHHDYEAGFACLADLLKQTDGIKVTVIKNGWPTDEAIFDSATCVAFYTDGGGRQAYLRSAGRIEKLNQLKDKGIGLVNIHQGVDHPDAHIEDALRWFGGTYGRKVSARGHWDSKHDTFPAHEVTRGVTPWEINDGWLNKLQMVETGITPLVWSGSKHVGSPEGGAADIVGWTYDRPDGGRSFSFSGLDAHEAWGRTGVRQLVTNGVLWAAKQKIPEAGAPCQLDDAKLNAYLTPRTAPQKKNAK